MTFLNLDNSTVSLLGTLGLLFVALKLWAVLQWLWIHFVCRNDLRWYAFNTLTSHFIMKLKF